MSLIIKSVADYAAPEISQVAVSVENGFAASTNEYTQGGGGTYDEGTINSNGEDY